MLELVLGPAGSGKGSYITEQLALLAEEGRQGLFLLVPEQYSFESERALQARLGAVAAARVQVVSFTRLAELVFREVGGLAGRHLDEGTRALLMSRAAQQVCAVAQDGGEDISTRLLRRTVQAEYVEQLLNLWSEMKQSGVSTEELDRVAGDLAAAEALSDSRLQEKTAELYRIFTAYEGLAAATGLDDLDQLTRLARQLPESGLMNSAAVFVDGFKGFTVQELAVLEGMLTAADRLTVALCTDTPGRDWPGATAAACRREFPLFSPVTDTVSRLRRLGEDHHVRLEIKWLSEGKKDAVPALQALESQLYYPAPTAFEGDASTVTVTPCEDVYEECVYVARAVRRLLRQEGLRCRDITLVARNPEAYAGILEDALAAQGIPCYLDARQDLLCEPLVVYARAALRLAVGGWRTEELLRLLKTDLGPLEPLETAELENYVYMWRLDGSAWEREWTENPDGLDAPVTSSSGYRLARLNDWRRRVMEPLITLRRRLRGDITGRDFALALYTFLSAEDCLAEKVAAGCARLETLAEPVLAARAARLWDELMGILDRFAVALGEERMPADRLEDMFTMLCRLIDLGNIPQSLDAVTVGAAHRIRYVSPAAVFILGANEGVFPAYPAVDGLFSETERRRLKACGLELSGDSLRQVVEERFYAYMAAAAPSRWLTITYHTGGGQVPSPLVSSVRTILPGHREDSPRWENGTDLEGAREMFDRLAEDYRWPTPTTAALQQVVAEQPLMADRLAAVAHSAAGVPLQLEQPAVAESLFGRDMCLSASQTERFYNCRFSYFCRYGLQIKPRPVAQVDAAVFGTLVHHVMETLLPAYTAPDGLVSQLQAEDAALTQDQRREREHARQAALFDRIQPDVERVTTAYIDEHMGGMGDKTGRFIYQVGQARRAAVNMLWHTLMELRQAAFRPVDFELSIHPEGEGEEGLLSLRLPFSGGSVQVRGQVDRVDLYVRPDGTAFVRVVDYKTGTKKFDLCELTAGLSMQMLLYLFILCDNSGRYLTQETSLRPAGVLYHPLSDLVIKRNESSENRLKTMQMSGLVLEDPDVVQAMEAEGAQVFIPAGLDKGGQVKGSAITARQFHLIRGVVEQLLTRMAEDLLSGDIAALPLQRGSSLPCDYCDYAAVCGRDGEDAVRSLERRTLKATLEELEQAAEQQEEVTVHGEARME